MHIYVHSMLQCLTEIEVNMYSFRNDDKASMQQDLLQAEEWVERTRARNRAAQVRFRHKLKARPVIYRQCLSWHSKSTT